MSTMDTTTLRGQRLLPVPCFTNQSQQLNFKPFFGLRCSRPITRYSQLISSQPHSWRVECPKRRLSFQISAAADFSKRRQRKGSSSRSRAPDSNPKGFTPKPRVGTSTQKDKRNYGDGETSVTSTSGVHERAHETGTDGIQEIEVSSRMDGVEDSTVDAVNGQVGEILKMGEKLAINMGNVNGSITVSHDDADDSSSALVSADHHESMTEFSDDPKTLTSLGSEQERHLESGDDVKISAARDEEGRSLVDFGFLESTSVAASVVDGEVGLGCDQVNLVPSFDDVKILVPWDKGRESLEGLGKDQVRPVGIDNEQKSLTTLQDNVRTLAELGGDQKSLVVSLHDQESLLSVSDQQESLVALVSDQKIPVASGRNKNSLVALGDSRKNLVASEKSDLGAALVEMGLGEEVDAAEDSEEKSDSLGGFKNSVGMGIYEVEDNLITEETLDETSSGAVLSEIPQELHEEQIEYDGVRMETNVVKQKSLEHYEDTTCEDSQAKDPSHTLKLEMEAHRRRQVLEELAEVNFSAHNKSFTYPELVKSGQEIEVFLNRSLSALKNEPDVLVTGAFNDWRWKSFTMSLEKTHLNGDWWSFKIHVPNEAYTIDFVFFNGKNVYENNDRKDFHVAVEEGLNAADFEEFLLEERRRELEMMAKEQAEKERQAEEQRRIQEENAANEADRAQAKLEIERGKANLEEIMKKATGSVDNLWYFEPQDFGGEDLVRLYYNRISGPLAHAKDIWIHGGHNNWTAGLSITTKLVKSERKDGDWWFAEVIVPDGALMLNWVFADGPPQNASVYDNNHRQDFHSVVPKSIPNELHWVEEEQRIYRRLQRERQERQEALRAKVEITARMKAVAKERSLKRFLMSQKHIVYTDPLDVQAGKNVTVYYNPANTVLSGKPEIWFRVSFNRWTHRNGPLAPQKMVPDENGSHVRTVVKVPLDAYMMDFVFSEKEDGGIFDNKDGIDYHVPVFGGIMKEPPMHIVHIAVEMAPIAKVGGLGDVVTSLSRAVQDLNHHVDIILPKYNCMNFNHVKDLHYQRSYPWGGTEIKVWFGKVEGLSVYFLDPSNGFFSTGCVYGCRNDGERFGFFCHAALEFLRQSGSNPDILHCHDWSSAPVSWLFKENYIQCGLSKARVVFTIHNLEFGAQLIGKAMAYSDKATTVSHAYSKEVAGNPAIAPHLQKFHGILNGIDPDIWDPFNDKYIPVAYTSENVVQGKAAAKEALQRKIGFRVGDIPLVGVISRLTHQKGIHLIKHAIRRTLERGGQVILLGSAPDPRIQNEFVDLANQLHSAQNDIARLFLTYDEPFSHMIYAAADFILVPSIFEPCGLTQLVAMRYGAIPVVRKTGGLYDTVFDVDHDEDRARALDLKPNGFSFEGADTAGVDYALDRAISAWYDKREWLHSLCKQVMEQDWSWNRPALDYLELYHAARKY